MSGVLTVLLGGGGQVPLLKPHSFADNTPGIAQPSVQFFRNGTVKFVQGTGAVTDLPLEWAGSAPSATIGDGYQVRATLLAGAFFDPEFDLADVWITLDDPVPGQASAKYLAPSPGSTGSASIRFEIRRVTPQIIVASAIWNIVWDGTP